MARVRLVEKEDLAAEHRHIYDEIATSRGGTIGAIKLGTENAERNTSCPI
jgi:hypothetical protein